MKIKPPLQLLALILLSCAVISIAGMIAKHTVCQAAGQFQDQPAITIPFLLLQDNTVLYAAHDEETSDQETNLTVQLPVYLLASLTTVMENEQPETITPHPVEESYFDDALFIGDSRTEGMAIFGRLGKADYFASSGMTVFNVLTKETQDINFSTTDLPSLLDSKQYGKIYIMLGINELGYAMESIMQKYENILKDIVSAQPNAKIILCANIYVTKEKSAAVSWLSWENINRLNNNIAALADNKTIFYLDANELFCDDSGYMDPAKTGDGVHPYATGYQEWAGWLQGHGI